MRISDWSSDVCSSDLLTGSLFANHWNSKSSDDLASYIAMNMPPGQGGTLSDREYRDITGFILRASGQQAAGTIAIKSENVAPSSPSQPNDKKAETGSEKGIDRKSTRLNSSH